MTPYYDRGGVTVYAGDCREVMAGMGSGSVDAVVCDPPYELGFMGKSWDSSGVAYRRETWEAVLRVLKPGGHLLAFGGTRTVHRMTVAIEDAGFEVRDTVMWLYGSGFPKSLDVSKAIDKAAGAEREVVAPNLNFRQNKEAHGNAIMRPRVAGEAEVRTAPATDDAREWDGWGTALKPAHEPIVVARKPLSSTVAANVLEHGTGALNIDAARIAGEVPSVPQPAYGGKADGVGLFGTGTGRNGEMSSAPLGRWPANVVLDPEAGAALDRQTGEGTSRIGKPRGAASGDGWGMTATGAEYDDSGGASRFFYCAKASKADRPRTADGTTHPTVKPVNLMRWLVRLVTPPGGTVLDPFAGSGSTLVAATIEGFEAVGIEQEPDYLAIIADRLSQPIAPVLDFGGDT